MKILILGGTAFLGKAVAAAALKRSHEVTCLARGTSQPPTGVTFVQADRENADALEAVAKHDWDAVVELTSVPAQAKQAVSQLSAKHWVFISSASVYADFSTPAQNESAETLPPSDDPQNYGGAKVACEQAMPTHSSIIRPGLIAGYGDWTSRSGYYPWRFAHPTGTDVIVADPDFPTAMIDVEDLSDWILDCAEQQLVGIFNVTGQTTTLHEVFQLCSELTGFSGGLRVITDPTLVNPWMGPKSLPLWIGDPAWRYVSILDCTLASTHGLKTRPLKETLAAALRYENERATPRQAGLTDEEEKELLALRPSV